MLSRHIARIAIEAGRDKVSEIITVIKDGDGNKNAADRIKITDYDQNATNLTPEFLLKFLMEFDPSLAIP